MSTGASVTDTEREQIAALRAALRDVWRSEFDDDLYLVRWLRARYHNIDKAEKMLRNHLEWRRRENWDQLMETYEPPEVLRRFSPGGYCGHDKEGCPLWADPIGKGDVKGLSRSTTLQQVTRYHLYQLEMLYKDIFPKRSAEEGKRITNSVSIFDLKDFGLAHMSKVAMSPITELAKLCSDHYPETMKAGFIINAPSFLPLLYKIVSPFLDEATRSKLHILGSDYEKVLLQYFDPENLPACYGGTMRDPDGDPRCPSRICWGGEVPEEFYLKSNKEYMTETNVSRGDILRLEYDVVNSGSRITWEFLTEDHDIGFGVFRKKSKAKDDLEEVVASRRVNSYLVPENGELEVSVPGRYVVQFDNSYSWTRGKHLWYRVDVLEAPPTSSTEEQAREYLHRHESFGSGSGTEAAVSSITPGQQ